MSLIPSPRGRVAIFLTLTRVKKPTRSPALGRGEVLVRETDRNFGQEIYTDTHRFTADKPVANGGQDTGPDPYELLLSGLGACTSMTVRMYAKHKKLPLDKISVKLRHEKIHAEDCQDCETREGKIDHIERELSFEGGELTSEQRHRLLEIANKCPVHRTLQSEIDIATSLVRSEG